jgi:endogenous inhibitor of DNA gyrase (YacG/DUF329 family)
LVTCPTCGAQSEYSPENPYRPFCSKRCKLMDLGQWATENYRIPITETSQEPPDEN